MRKLIATALLALGSTAAIAPAPVHAQGSDAFVGQMMTVGFNFCPRGWAKADSQLLAISSNDALFSLLGTTYGGDGRTTFGLPDLRGRVNIGDGDGPGLTSHRWGQQGGSERVTLTQANVPSHVHAIELKASSGGADTNDPTNAVLANTVSFTALGAPSINLNSGTVTTTATGGSQQFDIRQPYLAIQQCIALFGIYPSRQ